MEAYYNYFNQDDIFNAEWIEYVKNNYKYDPKIMYYPLVMIDEEKAFKSGFYDFGGRPCEPHAFKIITNSFYFNINDDSNGDQIGRVYSPEQVNRKAYDSWLMFRKKEFRKNFQNGISTNNGLNYYWITLNYAPSSDIDKVKFHTNRFVNLSCFKGCKMTYCYEFYTEQGSHPHVHILCELNRTGTIALSTILQLAFKDKSLYEVMSDEQKIDVKFSKGNIEKGQRARPKVELNAYLSGNKIEKKQCHSRLDVYWRKKNKLENLYVIKCV